jgi:hypothetical protein
MPFPMAVQLKPETSPLVTIVLLFAVTSVTMLVMYLGIPGTGFHGLRAGVHFDLEAGFEDARFMDNRIKCESAEALREVQNALVAIKSDYPIERVTVKLENYASGYKFAVRYVTYYAQRLNLGGEGKFFRRGAQVGDAELDREVKAKDDELEKAIRGALEKYFKAKGAQ